MAAAKDLYATLGVTRDVSPDELRKVYRRLARKYHPDVNPGDKAAEEKFKELSAAYDVLANSDKRKLYDEFGVDGLREGFEPSRAREYQQWTRERQATGGGAGQGHGFDFDFDVGDLFGDMFGGAGGRAGRRRSQRQAGQDLSATVEVDLAQALAGTEVKLELPTPELCGACRGSGEKPGTSPKICPDCGGSGRRQAVRGPMRMMNTCSTCGGGGRVAEPCPTCGGQGAVGSRQTVTVRIPPGADDGSRLRVAGRGAPGVGGGPPGDLVIETRVRPHPYFTRQGLDLRLRLPVTLAEAYEGSTVEVPTPSGAVRLRVPPRTQQGTELRLRGKGVKRGAEQGDLYVVVEVRLPDKDDPKLREAFAEASGAYERPVREGIVL